MGMRGCVSGAPRTKRNPKSAKSNGKTVLITLEPLDHALSPLSLDVLSLTDAPGPLIAVPRRT